MNRRCGNCEHFDGPPTGGDGIGDCYDPAREAAELRHRDQPACGSFDPAPATPED